MRERLFRRREKQRQSHGNRGTSGVFEKWQK